MAPFLNVVTRHMPAREKLLARCSASLATQTDPDYEQITIQDDAGRGFEHAARMLATAAEWVTADYVLVLDDDDVVEAKDAIVALKRAAAARPPAVIFRGRHAELGVLPREHWQQRPARGDIGIFDFILRADVYRKFITIPIAHPYAFDHDLIDAVYQAHAGAIVWLDRILCSADRRRIGALA